MLVNNKNWTRNVCIDLLFILGQNIEFTKVQKSDSLLSWKLNSNFVACIALLNIRLVAISRHKSECLLYNLLLSFLIIFQISFSLVLCYNSAPRNMGIFALYFLCIL